MNKRKMAKVVGAGVVTAAGIVVVKKLLGAGTVATIVGGVMVGAAHEALDAPVSGWIYKQLP